MYIYTYIAKLQWPLLHYLNASVLDIYTHFKASPVFSGLPTLKTRLSAVVTIKWHQDMFSSFALASPWPCPLSSSNKAFIHTKAQMEAQGERGYTPPAYGCQPLALAQTNSPLSFSPVPGTSKILVLLTGYMWTVSGVDWRPEGTVIQGLLDS